MTDSKQAHDNSQGHGARSKNRIVAASDVRVDTWGAGVDFPIFDAKTRSFKKSVLGRAGGVIGASDSGVPMVEALRDIDLHLEHGDRIGLVGHNGAGKSTLLRLLVDPDPPLKADGGLIARRRGLRVGYVAQEPVLFSGTIHDNIAYGVPNASRADVERAIAAAKAIGARRTVLTHLTHETGHAALAHALPDGIEPGYDGKGDR